MALLCVSCVSKKKYTEIEGNYNNTRSELLKTKVAQEDLQRQMKQIQMRVERYNQKIASLNTDNSVLKNEMLVNSSDGSIVVSENNKAAMRKTLQEVPEYKLATAST